MSEKFRREVEAHFNEPILMGTEIARVIGYAEDERDCYIIVHYPDLGIIWHTMVGGYYYLSALSAQGMVIGYTGEKWDDLWRLSGDLERAGVPKRKEFECITE